MKRYSGAALLCVFRLVFALGTMDLKGQYKFVAKVKVWYGRT
jgi:hypothetical protein